MKQRTGWLPQLVIRNPLAASVPVSLQNPGSRQDRNYYYYIQTQKKEACEKYEPRAFPESPQIIQEELHISLNKPAIISAVETKLPALLPRRKAEMEHLPSEHRVTHNGEGRRKIAWIKHKSTLKPSASLFPPPCTEEGGIQALKPDRSIPGIGILQTAFFERPLVIWTWPHWSKGERGESYQTTSERPIPQFVKTLYLEARFYFFWSHWGPLPHPHVCAIFCQALRIVMKINSIAIKLSTSLNHPRKKQTQFPNPVTQFKAVSKF